MYKKALAHFKTADRTLYRLAKNHEILIEARSDHFLSLVESIVSQQLSEKAGTTIYNRFINLFSKLPVTPQKVLLLDDNTIRSAGLSFSKVTYIKNLSTALVANELDFSNIAEQSDEEVIKELTKIKGIGRWTAEMFLIFSLGRQDVFSYGDLGLRHGLQKLYGLTVEPTKEEAEKITSEWAPYRSYGSVLLWRSLSAK